MALSANAVDLVRRIRASRLECVMSYARGESSLVDVVNRAKDSPDLQDLYLVKLIEANPRVGKVQARRLMNEFHLRPETSVSSVDIDLILRLEVAISAKSDRP